MYKIPDTYVYLSPWNPSINLRQVGSDTPYPGYQYGPAIRDFYLVHIITKGYGVYSARGVDYDLKEGDAFLIYPNELTVYKADKAEPWEYYFFSFSGAMARDLLPGMGFTGDRLTTTLSNPREIADLIMECVDAIDSNSTINHLSSIEHLFRIATTFSRNVSSDEGEEIQVNAYIQKAIAYIELNYANNITINDLAKALAIDRSYLYRVFKSGTGVSPKEYLNDYRLNAARQLLENTDHSISQIALSSGFFSFSAFYRSFVQKYGHSPREYQNAYRSKKSNAETTDNK